MAVTDYDITATEVFETIGHIDQESASPQLAVVERWVLRFAADVNLAMRGVGTSPAVTSSSDPELYQAIRQKIIARVSAEWLMSNNRMDSESYHVQTLIGEWLAFVDNLRERPSHVLGQTGHDKSVRYNDSTTGDTLADIIAAQIAGRVARTFNDSSGFN